MDSLSTFFLETLCFLKILFCISTIKIYLYTNKSIHIYLNSDGTKFLWSDYSGHASQYNLVNNSWEFQALYPLNASQIFVISDDFSTIVGTNGNTYNFIGNEWVIGETVPFLQSFDEMSINLFYF